MNPTDKKKLSNEQRLNAIKQWKKNRTFQTSSINTFKGQHSKIIQEPDQDEKLKLFDSDEEEEKYENCFEIRPQFEGPHGQHLLEMSSQLSDRFKLDERFKEDESSTSTDENEERTKNLKILESVLGHEVPGKLPDEQKLMKKRQIRFDPEDEYATKYIKISESSEKKPKKKKEKKDVIENNVQETIPISSERYIEVSSDLKDILSSSSNQFSLSQKFSQVEDIQEETHSPLQTESWAKEDTNHAKSANRVLKSDSLSQNRKYSIPFFEPKMQQQPFFITEDDPRLKEGIEFFRRPKPLEELREQWQKRREKALEIFRKKKKSNQRGHSSKVQNTQKQYAARKKMNIHVNM